LYGLVNFILGQAQFGIVDNLYIPVAEIDEILLSKLSMHYIDQDQDFSYKTFIAMVVLILLCIHCAN